MIDEYKETSLGLIPRNWDIVSIDSVCSVKGRIGFRGYTKADLVKKGQGALTIGAKHISNNLQLNFDDPEYISWEKYEESPEIKVEIGDILFVQRGSLGKAAFVKKLDEPATINPSMVLIKKIKCNRIFLYYCLTGKIIQDEVLKVTTSTAVPMISQKQIKEFIIPLPPPPEQKKIADILTTVDDKLENIESQIAEYTNLKKGLMQQLLTKGIGHSKFVDSKLGMIPEGWRVVKLGEIGSTYNGLSGKSKDDFGNGEPYIPYMNIFSNNTINPNWLEYVSISPDENQNAVKYGDVFFTTSSETPEEVGMSSVLLDDIGTVYLNSFCFGFRLNDFNALLPDYAKFLFRGQAVRKSIVVFAQGSTRFNLSKTNLLKRLHLALPPISEQKEIANILTSVDEKMKSLLQKKEEYTKLKKGLMEQLLTGRIRVKV